MKKVVKILRGIGYLLAFSLILYPVVSNYINQMNSTTIATDYEQEVSHLSEEQGKCKQLTVVNRLILNF